MKEYQRRDGVMYLYDGDDKKILVYTLIPKNGAFYNYKKRELETIPEDNRLLRARSSTGLGPLIKALYPENCGERVRKMKGREVSFGDIFTERYHYIKPSLIPENSYAYRNPIVNYYITLGPSKYLEIEPDGTIEIKNIKALILGNSDYHFADPYDEFLKEDIINIPASLLKLEQFMDGCFDEVDESQIEEILNLYEPIDINAPIYIKELDDVEKMDKYFPRVVALKSAMQHDIQNDAKVMSLIKKHR